MAVRVMVDALPQKLLLLTVADVGATGSGRTVTVTLTQLDVPQAVTQLA